MSHLFNDTDSSDSGHLWGVVVGRTTHVLRLAFILLSLIYWGDHAVIDRLQRHAAENVPCPVLNDGIREETARVATQTHMAVPIASQCP